MADREQVKYLLTRPVSFQWTHHTTALCITARGSKANKSEFACTASHFEKETFENEDNLWMLFFSHPFLSRQGKKGTIWMGYAPSQHHRTCLHKQPYMQLNLLASNCANMQLVGTKPASAEDRLLSSPPLSIRRADVSCTVIFWVTAGWAEPWRWPLLRGGGWWKNKDTSTTEMLAKLWSYGENLSFLSLSNKALTALSASAS